MKRNVDLNGPWSMPPRRQHYENHYHIQITIYNPNEKDKDGNDKIVANQVIDYGEYEDRKFLGRITHWAMENDYIVECMKVSKD